tara:strand:- start:1192 stop:1383 length:192 start_codon:yes stop_codon:yes gene_type:complete
MEFFTGFFIGILSVSLVKIARYITRKDYELVSRLEPNDFDYNGSTGDLTVKQIIESVRKEGTK